MKGKGEKERYTHFNTEIQRRARKDKKPSSAINAKKLENNRMGKTRDLFKKIKDNRGLFHANMSSVKGRNDRDLKKAEDIKKGWKEYTEELHKKIFMTQIAKMM